MSSTIVTCYYKIKSKKTHDLYDIYINNLFNNLNPLSNIVIFTSDDLVDYLKQKIINNKNFKIIVKNFENIELFNKYKHIWDSQYEMDLQKDNGRGIECYVIWNSKLNFVKEVIDINPFNSDKFIWMDIGLIRNNTYMEFLKTFPNYENISKNKIDISLLNIFEKNNLFFQDEIYFSGAIFGGGIDIFKIFIEKYYNKFDDYVNNNKFIGCDQQIISSVFIENKQLINPINCYNKGDITLENSKIIKKLFHLDYWFYLVYVYS